MLTAAGRWTTIGRGIRVRESRAYRMNSVLLLSSRHSVVVDPGVLPSEIEEIAAAVAAVRPQRLTLVFTHAHWDHVVGRSRWPEAATVGHARMASELQREAATIGRKAAELAERAGEPAPPPFQAFEPDLTVGPGQTARLGHWVVTFLDGAGHADTQIAVHVASRRLLLAADMLSDIEIPILHGPVSTYLRTLEGLRPLIESGEVEWLVPGHGSICRGAEAIRERLERDLAYLARLENGVRAARTAGGTVDHARRQLAAMDYTGKTAEYSMTSIHDENIRHAWEGVVEGA